METAFNVNYSVMSKSTSNASAVLSSQCTQRTPLFTRIQVVFKRFKHSGLFTRQTVKGLKGIFLFAWRDNGNYAYTPFKIKETPNQT